MRKTFSVAGQRTAARLCLWLALSAWAPLAYSSSNGAFDGERAGRISRAIEQAVAAGEIPGAVALVALNGNTVYHQAFGYADVAAEEPATVDTIYRIASMTKAVTTVGVMMLYEQGHFLLNDPVGDYLPEFANMQVATEFDDEGNVAGTEPAQSPIRIIHLLTHTAGIGYPFLPGQLQKTYLDAGVIDGLTTEHVALARQMELLAQQPLLFEPGTRFNYGLSTDVLGRLIEVVSGQSLDNFFRSEIFEPLGMTDTHFYLPQDDASRLAMLYAHDANGNLVEMQESMPDINLGDLNFPVSGARSYYSGGAGLSSTARDYARFLQMLLNNGELDGKRILSRKSVELMRTPRVDIDGDDVPEVSLGFRVVTDLGERGELGSVGEYSWGGAFYTMFWVDPAENLIGVFMSQGRPLDSSIASRFRVLAYQALE